MIHTDELYRKIYENAEKEYTEYITELKEKDAEYLIDHAYETVFNGFSKKVQKQILEEA